MLFQEKALLESDILELKKTCAKLTKDYRRQEEIASVSIIDKSRYLVFQFFFLREYSMHHLIM